MPRARSARVSSSRPEDPHAAERADRARGGGDGERAAVDRGHQRDPPAGGEHADELVDRLHRLVDQVQRREAADGVEAALAERQLAGVAAHEGDVRAARRAGRALEHRRRGVEADHEPRLADGLAEAPRERARPAGHVEHALAAEQVQHLLGHHELVAHARPHHAHQRAAEHGAPDALVDHRQRAAGHQLLAGVVSDRVGGRRAGRRSRPARPWRRAGRPACRGRARAPRRRSTSPRASRPRRAP